MSGPRSTKGSVAGHEQVKDGDGVGPQRPSPRGDPGRGAPHLEVTHIRSVAQERPAAGLRRREPELPEGGGEERHSALGHALDHPPDPRIARLGQEVDVGRSPELVEKRQLEEALEPPGRVGDGIELLDHLGRSKLLEHVEGCLDELIAAGEVPVEAALGRAKLLGEGLDRNCGEPAVGDRVQRGQGPVVASQCHLPYGTVLATIRSRMDRPTNRHVLADLAARGLSPRATSLALATLAATHVYWAAGGVWPAASRESLAETVVGPGAAFPPDIATYGVAAVLAGGSFVVAGAARRWRRPVSPESYGAAARVGAAILAVRGIVGLTTSLAAGLEAPYHRWDVVVYSPLCLLLAAGVWKAACAE